MKMCTSLLFNLCAQMAKTRAKKADKPTKSAESRELKKGTDHGPRNMFLKILFFFKCYVQEDLARPLLMRLDGCMQKTLSIEEVRALLEVSKMIAACIFVFYACEIPLHRNKKGAKGAAEAAEAAHGQTVESQVYVKMLAGQKRDALIVRIMVHALLFGIHMEAAPLTFAGQHVDGGEAKVPTKLLSVLVDRTIYCLSLVMYGFHGTCVDCDFGVCEAISQSMSANASVVPRARVAQLMDEWCLEQHRVVVNKIITAGGLCADPSSSTCTKDTERVLFLAHVWVCPWNGTELLSRRLVVITTQFNLAILEVPMAVGHEESIQEHEVRVVSCRNLHQLIRIVLHPQMLQLIGLIWEQEPDDPKSNRDFVGFESTTRRKIFKDIISQVPENFKRGGKKQTTPRERMLHSNVTLALKESVKTEKGEVSLCSVLFVRSSDLMGNMGIQALVLGEQRIALVDMSELVLRIEKNSEYYFEDEAEVGISCDSDTDDDTMLDPQAVDVNRIDEVGALEATPASKDWSLPKLKGVRFLREAEPKVILKFQGDETIQFFTECERQRFRRQLSIILQGMEEEKSKSNKSKSDGKTWMAVQSKNTNLSVVEKEVQEVLQDEMKKKHT
eukprot:NODE_1743_length_2387_cov_6.496903.p1 GENE.NODE_1743_length_2387_cov_6.496903~~NODE_1743_length_2387_cov_6.496903.p1  ORF type:complete len:627 (-),score=220.82 NODE_1743_length_2387_cov_6.496903:507-2351(-)